MGIVATLIIRCRIGTIFKVRMRLHHLILFLLYHLAALLCNTSLIAQPQKNFQHIGVEEGLSQSTILGITQDSCGFIWLATRDGLNRYDGYDFNTWYRDTSAPYQLPSGFVKEIFRDSKGYLWAGTSAGLRIYQAAGNSFYTPDQHLGFVTGLPNRVEVWKIYEYPKGHIWLLTLHDGVYVCHVVRKTIQHFTPQNSPLQHTWLRSLAVNAPGQLYLASPYHVYPVQQQSDTQFTIAPACISHLQQDAEDIGIQDMIFEQDTLLWIGCHNTGIAVWNTHAQQWQRRKGDFPVRVFYRDADSTIWTGSFGAGLFRYTRQKGMEQFVNQAFSPGSLCSNFIRSLYQDKQGLLWIGTEDEGISIYDPASNQITSYDNRDWRLTHFKNVRAIYAEGDSVFTGSTITSLAVFDVVRKQLTAVIAPGQPVQHRYDIVTQLLPQSDNTLLVASYGSGLFSLHKRTLQLQPVPGLEGVKNITRLVQRANGAIWLCTNKGFYLYTPVGEQLQYYCPAHSALQSFAGTYIKNVFEQGDTLWIATDNKGLYAYSLSRQRLLPLSLAHASTSLPMAVNSFLPAPHGLWLATYENGLVYLDVRTGTSNVLNRRHSIPHHLALHLLQDNMGNIWESTNKGLIQFNPTTNRVRLFDHNNGTQGQEYYIGSGCKDRNGRLWFGGKNGFDCVFPEKITDGPKPFPVRVTGLRIQDKDLLTDTAISLKKRITLSYQQNFITLEFAAPNFSQPGRIRYMYRLRGIDKDWVQAGNIRQARYTGLPGGDYLFEASIMNDDGQPTGTPALLRITVQQPFWNTWWFYVLCALTIALIVYAAWRYRMHQLEALNHMRNHISRDLHDDIGGTLSSIHILTEVARQKALQHQAEQSAGILEKVNTLALDMVGRMSDTIWAINPANDNPDKLLERLRHQFLPACTAKGISLELISKGLQHAITTDMHKRKQLYMATKEILNNAIKHSGCHLLTMQASFANKQFHLVITDDGKGFDTSVASTGNGLSNIQQRILSVKGTIRIDSTPGKGTVTRFSIPMS